MPCPQVGVWGRLCGNYQSRWALGAERSCWPSPTSRWWWPSTWKKWRPPPRHRIYINSRTSIYFQSAPSRAALNLHAFSFLLLRFGSRSQSLSWNIYICIVAQNWHIPCNRAKCPGESISFMLRKQIIRVGSKLWKRVSHHWDLKVSSLNAVSKRLTSSFQTPMDQGWKTGPFRPGLIQ